MKLGKTADSTLAGFDDPALGELQERARMANIARRAVFVARLPLAPGIVGLADVPSWSAAIQQIEQNQWKLAEWSVCPETDGPVAYAVFKKA